MEIIKHHPVFFTATIKNWRKLLKPEKYKKIIIEQLRAQIEKNHIIVYAYCIMDNHIHTIWQVKGNISTSEVQKQFLEGCSKKIKIDLEKFHPKVLEIFKSTQKDRAFHFWKRDALSIELYNDKIFQQKMEYIHNNPLEAGLCQYPEEYIYSSASFYLLNEDKFSILTHCYG
jgi:REP element-mobilizing transposase RayT